MIQARAQTRTALSGVERAYQNPTLVTIYEVKINKNSLFVFSILPARKASKPEQFHFDDIARDVSRVPDWLLLG